MQARFAPEQSAIDAVSTHRQSTSSASSGQLTQALDYSQLVDAAHLRDQRVKVLHQQQSGIAPIATALLALAIAFTLMFFPRLFGIRAEKRFR